ncbi:transformer-2 protein homolog alpha-like [Anopheles nili]|uniref:transformer-2 protein homolog alpha-like n=1 Tax=Anopheles nili TaxID=185578 RepID=UPI00237A201B|nr:transformer-2 protein homolog alpha-like [Anopheles nili]
MSHSRNYNYYENSRSRSRERSYRREYRDDSERYHSTTESSRGADYSASSYRRSSHHRSSHSTSHYHDHPPASSSSGMAGLECSSHGSSGKVVLAVFNLSIYTTEAELYDTFSKFGPLRKTTVVLDAKTGRSRGFGFVYFESSEDAKVAHDQANGIEIGDRRIRVDFSATNKPHDPTPGVYYGKVSHPKGGGYGAHSGHGMSSMSGYHHCRACEVEARDRERWERDARARDHYYHDSYSGHDRSRDRSMTGRSGRSDYYRGGTSIR